jgi:hypothetical protein
MLQPLSSKSFLFVCVRLGYCDTWLDDWCPMFWDCQAVQKRWTPFYVIHGYTVCNPTNWANNHQYSLFCDAVFFYGSAAPSGPGPPRCWGFTITLGHTTLSRTPLDDWSAWRIPFYLTAHNTHKRQTSIPPAEFEHCDPSKGAAADQSFRLCVVMLLVGLNTV